jgi:hypothetical protein
MRSAWICTRNDPSFGKSCRGDTTGKTPKTAACFARRVKGAAQKYFSSETRKFMI